MINKFAAAMLENGIEHPATIHPDGILHRFKINGKSCGWYVLHGGEYAAGTFGDWATGLKVKWRQDSDVKQTFTKEQREKFAAIKAERDVKKRDLARYSADKCRSSFNNAKPLQDSYHDYITKKGFDFGDVCSMNVRKSGSDVLIPIYNRWGEMINMQTIKPDGIKKFAYGAEIIGGHHIIGSYTGKIYVCEGWATGVSLHNYFSDMVIVSFNAGNLVPVSKIVKELYPEAEIVIAADNDASGTGERYAIESCRAIGATYIMPDAVGQDWNDVL